MKNWRYAALVSFSVITATAGDQSQAAPSFQLGEVIDRPVAVQQRSEAQTTAAAGNSALAIARYEEAISQVSASSNEAELAVADAAHEGLADLRMQRSEWPRAIRRLSHLEVAWAGEYWLTGDSNVMRRLAGLRIKLARALLNSGDGNGAALRAEWASVALKNNTASDIQALTLAANALWADALISTGSWQQALAPSTEAARLSANSASLSIGERETHRARLERVAAHAREPVPAPLVDDEAARSGRQLIDQAVLAAQRGQAAEAASLATEGVNQLRKAPVPEDNGFAQALWVQAQALAGSGQPALASRATAEVLSIHTRLFGGESSRTAESRVRHGFMLRLAGEFSAAIKQLEAAQSVLEIHKSEDANLLVMAYSNLALAYVSVNQQVTTSQRVSGFVGLAVVWGYERAIKVAQRAIELESQSEVGPSSPLAQMLRLVVAWVHLSQLNEVDAGISVCESVVAAGALQDPQGRRLVNLAQTLLMMSYAVKQNFDVAILWGKQAANDLHELPPEDPVDEDALNPVADQMFPGLRESVHQGVAVLLTRQGRLEEAQQVLQMLKEHELQSQVRSAADDPRQQRAELTGLEQKHLAPYQALRSQQISMARELAQLTEAQRGRKPTPAERARATALRKQANEEIPGAIRQAMSRAAVELPAEVNAASESTPTRQWTATRLTQAVRQLARDEPTSGAVGLQYFAHRDGLTIVITPAKGPLVAREIPTDTQALYAQIRQLGLLLQAPDASKEACDELLRKLHDQLFKPIAADLAAAGAKTLMFSLDGRLRLVPFAALIDERGAPVLHRYAVAFFNEASGQSQFSKPQARWRVAAMGLSEAVDGLPALKAVPEELAAIVRQPGMSGTSHLNREFTANRLSLSGQESSGYNVLHVASHFQFRAGQPQNSHLYLGDGSRLSLLDLSEPRWNFGAFDLVTFSACQTAVGGGFDVRGKEMESLSALAQRQGASAVMATLWKVSDDSTGKLMAQVYALRASGLSKAEALRQAQLAMFNGTLPGQKSQWRAPHHWAGFVVSGNWR